MTPAPVDFADSRIPCETLRAYLETRYVVRGDPPLALRIGESSVGLRALHGRFGVACSAFVTAWNPFGARAQDADNDARQAALVAALEADGRTWLDGIGRHPDGGWPGEASVLVPGMGRVGACALAHRFEQNALVWCGANAVPELVLLR